MTWNHKFSRIVFFAILFTFFVTVVSAQEGVSIRKSATGRVAANHPIRRETRRETSPNLSNDEQQIHYLVNTERRKKGLNDLYWDEDLAKLARNYSKKMARESFFSHFDSDGNSIIDRANDSDIRGWNKIGENLFFCEGYRDFDVLAVNGWMNSTEHRRNILDRQFTTTGIGVAQTRDGRIYITQVFIRN
jgi:uncharacterized protein YkwD